MNNIAPVGHTAAPTSVSKSEVAAHTASSGHDRGKDQVELSTAAQLLARLNELPDVREELVAKVRGQILEGTYETPDKLESALSELALDLEDLD